MTIANPARSDVPANDVRSALRTATAPYHARVDRLYSLIDLGDRDAYGRFLTAQASAHLSAEQALGQAGVAAVLDDWPERRRGDLLCADLAAMGLPIPDLTTDLMLDGADAVLGSVYVLEGSRLGGRVLRRSVPQGFPCEFLDAADPAAWRRLLAFLEQRLVGDAQRQRAITAAISVFTLFEHAANRHLA